MKREREGRGERSRIGRKDQFRKMESRLQGASTENGV